jgi:hypothetical protein
MCRYWQGPAISTNKHTMATPIMPPFNSNLAGHNLKMPDLPIEGVVSHRFKQFGGGVHSTIVQLVISDVKRVCRVEKFK